MRADGKRGIDLREYFYLLLTYSVLEPCIDRQRNDERRIGLSLRMEMWARLIKCGLLPFLVSRLCFGFSIYRLPKVKIKVK